MRLPLCQLGLCGADGGRKHGPSHPTQSGCSPGGDGKNFVLSLLPLCRIGCYSWIFEDIIVEFQLWQRNVWTATRSLKTEENELAYMPMLNEYISLVEKYIDEELLEWFLDITWWLSQPLHSTIKMKWLMTYLTCYQHWPIFWLLKEYFFTTEQKQQPGDWTYAMV